MITLFCLLSLWCQSALPTQQVAQQAFDFTNKFRATNSLPSLTWNQPIAAVAYEHAKAMGKKIVPFGHANFEERKKAIPAGWKKMAENVYRSNYPGDIARQAVDGWINSPGHRKNLLGTFTTCGIGMYRNAKGMWYLTQIFASY